MRTVDGSVPSAKNSLKLGCGENFPIAKGKVAARFQTCTTLPLQIRAPQENMNAGLISTRIKRRVSNAIKYRYNIVYNIDIIRIDNCYEFLGARVTVSRLTRTSTVAGTVTTE